MKYTIVFSTSAFSDLTSIKSFIAADNPNIAKQYINSVIERIESLETLPYRGIKISNHYFDYAKIYYLVCLNHIVIYRVNELSKSVDIVRVLSHYQRWKDILNKELLNMSDVIIKNNVISINKMNHSMVHDVFQNSQDENNKKYVPDEVFDTLEEASEVVDFITKSYDSKDGPFIYAVIRKEDNVNMGYVQLVKIEEGWEIGYHIAAPYTGKGYATMAANLFIDYLKNNTDVKELYGIALAANKASRRVLEKCGFRLIFEGSGIYQGKRRKIIRTIRHLYMKDKLETERLLLRHFREDDAEAMFNNWASDPEVTKYMTWNPHENVETTKYILGLWMEEYKKPETIRFGITLKSSGELIGGIDVVEYIDNKPVIGYCLSRKYWNKGYMTEACTAMINYLFSLGYKEILISAVDENIGSNRVIQKCGFTFVNQEEAPMSNFKPEIVKINNYKINK